MPRGSRMRALMNWSKLWPLMTSISRAVTSVASERSEEHTSELQSQSNLVCRLLLEKQSEKRPPRQYKASQCKLSRRHPPTRANRAVVPRLQGSQYYPQHRSAAPVRALLTAALLGPD